MGFCRALSDGCAVAYLADVFVLPEHRGHGLGVGLVTPIALKRSAFRDKLKPVAARDFNPAVRAWLVHRPPAGRLTGPINLFRDGLDRELQALIRA